MHGSNGCSAAAWVAGGSIALSAAASLSLYIHQAARLTYVSARTGLFPVCLARINHHGVPWSAAVCNMVWMSACVVVGDFTQLLFFGSLANWLFNLLTVLAAARLLLQYPPTALDMPAARAASGSLRPLRRVVRDA